MTTACGSLSAGMRHSSGALCCALVALLVTVPAAGARYVITKDDGHALQDIDIKDLGAFLEFAGLGQEYKGPMEDEGLVLDDIKAITDEELEAIGMKKLMHRSRFLRYAKNLRVAPAKAPPPPKPKPKKKKKSPSPIDDSKPSDSKPSEEEYEEPEAARWAKADKQRKDAAKEDMKRAKEERLQSGDTSGPRKGTVDYEFYEAVEDEDVEGVETALKRGADIDVLIPANGGDMQTALMYSSLLGFEEVVDVLLQHGADFNRGLVQAEFTPLHGAAFQGHPGVVKLLLEAGADPLHRHKDGFIPMHRACWGTTPKHTESVLRFLEHGVDVLTDAVDPNESPQFDEQDGRMTPLNMSGTNPMTYGLLEEWEKHGRKPDGPVSYWGADVWGDEEGISIPEGTDPASIEVKEDL